MANLYLLKYGHQLALPQKCRGNLDPNDDNWPEYAETFIDNPNKKWPKIKFCLDVT